MRFLWPEMLWLLALLPLAVLVYLRLLRRRRREALSYSSLALVRVALGRGGRWRRHVPPALVLAAVAAALLAAARPSAVVTLPSDHITLVMAMDVSRSMLATDVNPNRITAAQAAARTFIGELPDNVRLGIVSFAASASVVQTLTDRREDLLAAIDRFELQRGTATGSGLLVALSMLRPDAGIDLESAIFGEGFSRRRRDESAQRPAAPAPPAALAPVLPGSWTRGAIVLLSDGRRTTGPDPIEAAKRAADLGVRVHTVGFGTRDGGEIPGMGGYSFWARLDEDTLKEIARITDGRYAFAGTAQDLAKVFENLHSQMGLEREETEIGALLAVFAAILLVLALGLSLRWFYRPGSMPRQGA